MKQSVSLSGVCVSTTLLFVKNDKIAPHVSTREEFEKCWVMSYKPGVSLNRKSKFQEQQDCLEQSGHSCEQEIKIRDTVCRLSGEHRTWPRCSNMGHTIDPGGDDTALHSNPKKNLSSFLFR